MTQEQIEQCSSYNAAFLQSIQDQMILINNGISKENKRHRDTMESLTALMAQNQGRCPHPKIFCEYIPDPWHSYYDCTLCGKSEVRPGT